MTNLTRCNTCYITSKQMKVCSRCNIIRYCSRECQSQDWSNHKLICIKSTKQKHNKIVDMYEYIDVLHCFVCGSIEAQCILIKLDIGTICNKCQHIHVNDTDKILNYISLNDYI